MPSPSPMILKIKWFFSLLLTILIVGGLLYGFYYIYQENIATPQGNVCNPSNAYYTNHCDNIGKKGYFITHDGIRLDYGTIVAVVWRPKGAIVSSVKKTRSTKNEHYYVLRRTGHDDRLEKVYRVKVE